MRKFENPIVIVSELDIADVITTSFECATDCSTNNCPTETPIV